VRVKRQGDTALLRFGLSSQSTHLHFTLYRWTKLVTYTVSSVLAVGYAYSAALVSLGAANSRVPKPWRKAYGGHPGVRARYPESRQMRGAGCRGSLHYSRAEVGVPGGGGAPKRSFRSGKSRHPLTSAGRPTGSSGLQGEAVWHSRAIWDGVGAFRALYCALRIRRRVKASAARARAEVMVRANSSRGNMTI